MGFRMTPRAVYRVLLFFGENQMYSLTVPGIKKPPRYDWNKVPVTSGRSSVGTAVASETMVSQNQGF